MRPINDPTRIAAPSAAPCMLCGEACGKGEPLEKKEESHGGSPLISPPPPALLQWLRVAGHTGKYFQIASLKIALKQDTKHTKNTTEER
jgi:hypothetical protein